MYNKIKTSYSMLLQEILAGVIFGQKYVDFYRIYTDNTRSIRR